MKILHIIGTLNIGGVQKFILELSRTPELIKYDYQVLCTFLSQDNYKAEYINNNFIIHYLPYTYLPTHWCPHRLDKLFRNLFERFYFFRLWLLLINSDVNIVHSHIHSHIVSQIFATVLSGKRMIWTIHGEYSLNKITILMVQAIQLITSSNKFQITAVSQYALHSTLPYSQGKTHLENIIPNGIDIKPYLNEIDNNKIRKKYNIENETILIGSTGRIVWQKGYDQLLSLLKNFDFGNKKFHILIAGEGSLRNQYIKWVKDNKLGSHITFIGNISNVIEFLSELDFYIQPSVTEGYCLSTLEAMTTGLPIICSDAGGLKDLIHNNKNGVVYKSGDLNSLYNGISKLLSMSKDELFVLGKNARKTVQNNYSINNSSLKYESIYNLE